MLCSWKIENVINYDQRNNNDYENALNTSSQDINYYGRNRSGKTYINGILSTKVKNNLTRNKKHLITGTFLEEVILQLLVLEVIILEMVIFLT